MIEQTSQVYRLGCFEEIFTLVDHRGRRTLATKGILDDFVFT
jgi:hypothetical protein